MCCAHWVIISLIMRLTIEAWGHSNMKVTYMCLPEYESRGHSCLLKKGFIPCGLQKKTCTFCWGSKKMGGHSVSENIIFMPKMQIFCENCPKNYKFVKVNTKHAKLFDLYVKFCTNWKKKGHWVWDWCEERGSNDRQLISTNIWECAPPPE